MSKDKLNSRQHLVLLNYLKGMTQTNAYKAVYGHDDNYFNLAQRASNLFTSVYFKAELDKQLNKQLADVEATVLSKSEKRQILAEIARSSLADHLDDDGEIKLDKSKAKAIREYSRRHHSDVNGNTSSAKALKLRDPISAIQEDNKMMGHYEPLRHHVDRNVTLEVRMVKKIMGEVIDGHARELAPGEDTGDN